MTTKAGKRPMRPLSTREKLDAIHRVHDGESKASVARDIGVPESTLRGWCKNEEKIALLSRQSSPETSDESLEPHHQDKKKLKIDENQPFNLSMKSPSGTSQHVHPSKIESPNFENNNKMPVSAGCFNTTPLDLKKIKEHNSEREKNRAELARLSIELGLNRPEMTTSNSTNNTSNIGLLAAQWNHLLLQQQQQQQITKKTISTKLPNEKIPVEESVRYWLNTSTPPHLSPNSNFPTGTTSSPMTGMTPEQSAWILKWYKTILQYNPYNNPMTTSSSQLPEKPILYQQLTKEKEPNENNVVTEDRHITNTKARAVLDTLLLNNNNNINKKEISAGGVSGSHHDNVDVTITQNEAVSHGEKFLKWLESCSEPSVTSMQIMQFRSLLSNVKTSAERKNGDFVPIRTKMKRK